MKKMEVMTGPPASQQYKHLWLASPSSLDASGEQQALSGMSHLPSCCYAFSTCV